MAESHFQFQQLKTLRKISHSPCCNPLFMASLPHLPNLNFKLGVCKHSSTLVSLARCSVSHRRSIPRLPFRPLLAAVRPRTLCKMSESDIMSQLELGKPEERRKPHKRVNGIFWVILLNLGIYAADHVFQKCRGYFFILGWKYGIQSLMPASIPIFSPTEK